MFDFGGFEWLVIILIIILLFGAKKIPELARGLGQGINEFRKASDEIKNEIDKGSRESADNQSEANKKDSQTDSKS
ncbi:MAG TPA: twin-arginine translocase TatA/TatE family subunit [Balneolales bacterium]|nr:twin-arginine translocase TatA/TatE family subunit [Balneolales bacterium]